MAPHQQMNEESFRRGMALGLASWSLLGVFQIGSSQLMTFGDVADVRLDVSSLLVKNRAPQSDPPPPV